MQQLQMWYVRCGDRSQVTWDAGGSAYRNTLTICIRQFREVSRYRQPICQWATYNYITCLIENNIFIQPCRGPHWLWSRLYGSLYLNQAGCIIPFSVLGVFSSTVIAPQTRGSFWWGELQADYSNDLLSCNWPSSNSAIIRFFKASQISISKQ